METTVELEKPIADQIEQVLAIFDDELRSDWPFVNRLTEQIHHYRGKLLRPTLLLTSGQAAGKLSHEHLVLAAVVEMVHMATLVHDDVLDEADLRRRHKTLNRMIGNEGAVLLGDFLISHAYHLASSLESTHASRRIAAVTNTVCEGELMQIENRGNFDLTEEDYLHVIRQKTASLTSLCCELGATFAGAGDAVIERLKAFGLNLGMAFQIVDDLLDLTASETQTGKTVGRDADLGKITLPLIRFLAQASSHERSELIDILSKTDNHKTRTVRAILDRTDCIEQAREKARFYAQSATDPLAALPPGEARSNLAAMAGFVVQRQQ